MNNSGKKIYNGFYDFKKLRLGNYIYVDKTRYLHRLVTDPEGGLYFVARPRRFGKSLMISTLKYILQGEKELFKGTYIYDKTDYDWPAVKVLHFDMSAIPMREPEKFSQNMTAYVRSVLEDSGYGAYDPEIDICLNFRNALRAFASQDSGPIAVLIDEYDAPIGHCLANIEQAEKIRDALHDLYVVLKSEVKNIRFLMLTGVSKFSQLSIFSGLNNVTDLYEDDTFATMFGYTERELDDNFGDLMKAHAEKMHLPYETYRAELKRWYNGYRFNENTETVYNPMAIAKTLSEQADEFRPTWTAEDRPAELLPFVKQAVEDGMDYLTGKVTADPDDVGLYGTWNDRQEPMDMLYQFGYLTIDHFDKGEWRLILRVPNEEMRLDLEAMTRSFSS